MLTFQKHSSHVRQPLYRAAVARLPRIPSLPLVIVEPGGFHILVSNFNAMLFEQLPQDCLMALLCCILL